MDNKNQNEFSKIAEKYGIVENDSFIVIDQSGCPLFKSYLKFENGSFKEYLPNNLSYPVDIDILNKVLSIYHATFKIVKGDELNWKKK